MANFKNSNDVYNKIISVDKLVDIDEIFFNGDEFDFVTKVTSYDPLAKKYTVATDELGETLERPFDVSLALEDLILSQYLPEFTDYFADINRYSTLTTEELSQLKDMLTKRSSFSYQFKGTKTAIEFVLSIFSNALGHYLLSADPDPYRNFVYRISTDLPREFWMKDVKPIVHPNGWGDNYILIIPEFPDYVQLKGEHEIREIIKHTPAAFSYLDLNYWHDLLKPKRTFTFVDSALASVGDLHEHFKFNFHHYKYEAAQAFTDGIRQELMLPGYFETGALRTSSAREYRLEYHRAGVALEYHWTIFRNGVIVRMEKTYQPTLDFTPVDDATHEVMLTLKRGTWEHTVGPFKLYTIHRPGVFPAQSAAPQITDESILDITAEDKLHRYELLDATRGDHHLNLFRDAEYGTTMTDWLALEAMAVSYDEPLAISTNYQTNRVFYTGPEMIDRYVWTVEKNGNPLVVRETIVPELVIDTAVWETEPESTPGIWPHPGVKSGWQVTLTVHQAGFSREVGTVTFGSMPDVVPPVAMTFTSLPATNTNSTVLNALPVDNADIFAYKWKLDSGAWSGEVERVSGVWQALTASGLSNGSHTLYWQARDAAGNWTTVSSYIWNIDTVAPSISLVTTIGNVTNQTSINIDVQTSDDAIEYAYQLDAAPFTSRFPLTTDIILTGLSQGSHTITVRGYDAAGNYSTATKTWTIDTVAPTAVITGFSQETIDGYWTKKRDYSFGVAVDPDVFTYQYKMGADPWSGDIPAATPFVENLKDGSFTLQVKGKDAAGNEQVTATQRTWEVRWSDQVYATPIAGSAGVMKAGNYLVKFNSVSLPTSFDVYDATTFALVRTVNTSLFGWPNMTTMWSSEQPDSIWISYTVSNSDIRFKRYDIANDIITSQQIIFSRVERVLERDGTLWYTANGNTDWVGWGIPSTGVTGSRAYPDESEPGTGEIIAGRAGVLYISTRSGSGVHKIYQFDMTTTLFLPTIVNFGAPVNGLTAMYDPYTSKLHTWSGAQPASSARNEFTLAAEPAFDIPFPDSNITQSLFPMSDRFIRIVKPFTTRYNSTVQEIDRSSGTLTRQKIVVTSVTLSHGIIQYEPTMNGGYAVSRGDYVTNQVGGPGEVYNTNHLVYSDIRW